MTTTGSTRRRVTTTATTSARTWSIALSFIHDAKSVRPDRPFFCYLAFGATRPASGPAAVRHQYRGRFDGWDVAGRWFARQVKLGLVPGAQASHRAIPG
jgi:arylsulfatase A-like enzyme